MAEHTPTPWTAASAYSSIVGVPIINSKGKRVGNTALPDLPAEWGEMKERAVADAAFIVKAVNNHEALVKELEEQREYLAGKSTSAALNGFPADDGIQDRIDRITRVLAGVVGGSSK